MQKNERMKLHKNEKNKIKNIKKLHKNEKIEN